MVKAFDKGVLWNTSLQVPTPAFADAVVRFRNLPDLCIGLHATINAEWETPWWGPLLSAARVPSLVDENSLFPAGYEHADPDEIMEEVNVPALFGDGQLLQLFAVSQRRKVVEILAFALHVFYDIL